MADSTPYVSIRWDFHFLVYQEGGVVHAHCLDTDTVATGSSPEKAVRNLQAALELQIEDCRKRGTFDDLWTRAPEEYWAKAKRYAFKASRVERRPRKVVERTLESTAAELHEAAK